MGRIDEDATNLGKYDKFSRTPLSWAAENGREAVAKLLLDKNADVNSKEDVIARHRSHGHSRTASWGQESFNDSNLCLRAGCTIFAFIMILPL
jgi:ankyrin repeat protein